MVKASHLFYPSSFSIIVLLLQLANAQKIYYVDKAVNPTGDGSKNSPFLTIEEAITAAKNLATNPMPTTVTISIEKGMYTLAASINLSNLPYDLTILGSPTANTNITCPANGAGHFTTTGSTKKVAIKNLTIQDCNTSSSSPIEISNTADVALDTVTITNNVQSGAIRIAEDSTLSLSNVLMKENTPRPGDESCGLDLRGISIVSGNIVTIDCLNSGGGTGIVGDSSGKLTLTQLNVIGATAKDSSVGSAIKLLSGSAVISKATFNNNNGTNGGVAFITNSASVSITDATLQNSVASNMGGFVYAEKQGFFSCTNCYLSDFKATIGGCFYAKEVSQINLNNVTVFGGYKTSAISGSVMVLTGSVQVVATDLTIRGAIAEAGTIGYSQAVSANFTRLKVFDNYNVKNYGGIFNAQAPGSGSVVNIYDSLFYNQTQGQATVGTLDHGNFNMYNSVINVSTTPLNGGGAVAFQVNSATVTMLLKDSTIMNSAGTWGGCISQYGGMVTLDNVLLQYNTISSSSSVYFQNPGSKTVIRNSRILNNGWSPYHSTKYWSTWSGSFAVYGDMQVINTTFWGDNSKRFGNMVVRTSGNLYMKDSRLGGATSATAGGGIKLENGWFGNVTIEDTIFHDNVVVQNGAGLFIEAPSQTAMTPSTSVTLRRITFKNNTAVYGGGIYSDVPSTRISCTDCNFIGNKALIGGGAAFTRYTNEKINLMGTTLFQNNSASYGADLSTEPVAAKIKSISVDGMNYSDFSLLSIYSGSKLQNAMITIVDGFGQTFVSSVRLRDSSTSSLILTQFVLNSPNATITGDTAALCWKGACKHANVVVAGSPGNYTLTLKFAQYGGFSVLSTFKLEIPVTINQCPDSNTSYVKQAPTMKIPFETCIVPFCSGCKNGRCVSDNTCQCFETWFGPDCSQRAQYKSNQGVKIAFFVIAAVSMVYSILLLAGLIYKKSSKVVRRSSPIFLYLMCVGSMVRYAAIFADGADPSVGSCVAYLWMKYIGFCLIFGSILTKTHRINAIFRSTRRIQLRDIDLFKIFGPIMLIFTLCLIVWSSADQPQVMSGISSKNTDFMYCHAPRSIPLGLLVCGLCYAWGVYLAFNTRNVAADFNEAKSIGASIYVWAIIDVFIEVLGMATKLDPDLLFIVHSIGNLVINLVASTVILATKITGAMKAEPKSKTTTAKNMSSSLPPGITSGNGLTSSG
ncbi:hypothetical protein HK098_005491 [Nowakowskiella sp. JEL0407]|nr:hypothetical protein HK098_005491 [Nowakowskiella sp. JEL0407]